MSPPLGEGRRTADEWVREYAETHHVPPGSGRHRDSGCAAGGATDSAADGGDDGLPLLLFDDIEPVLDTKDFVQGLLVENSAAVVYGESNVGKSFLTTDLALHVAAGMPWHGRRVERGGVVYAVLEGGFGFRNRVAAWRKAHRGTNASFAAIPAPLDLLDPDGDTPRLIAAIKKAQTSLGVPVKLVVIDTLARAMAGGNENGPEAMGALVKSMDLIREATGACVLFIHHSGKDAAKGARGHSSLRAAIDTEIEIRATEGSDVMVATVVKQREMRKGDVFGFTLDVVEVGQNRHGEAVTTCVVDPAEGEPPKSASKISNDQKAALAVLHDLLAQRGETGQAGVPHGVPSVPEAWWRDRYYERCKIGASQDTKKHAFRRAVDALQGAGRVAADAGRVWLGRPDA